MATLQWSSPSPSLTPIPLEIYEEILSYFHEDGDTTAKELHRDLANLALVCRYFASLTLPRIFKKISFCGSPTTPHGETVPKSRFCQALLNDQEPAKTLAQYVKICEFNNWSSVGTNIPLNVFFSMYCGAFAKMTQVESLELDAVFVDKRLIEPMKQLRCLKSLRLSRCRFSPGLNPDDIRAVGQALCLQSLVIIMPNQDYVLPLLHDTFTSTLKFTSLKVLEVDRWGTIQRLANSTTPLPLEKLIIHEIEDAELLPILFQKFPGVLELDIWSVNIPLHDSLDSIHIPTDVLPKLSVFSGPPALAALLVPSRPLCNVQLLGTLVWFEAELALSDTESFSGTMLYSLPPPSISLWTSLGEGTASISEIAIPQQFYFLAPLARVLPEVRMVKLSWFHDNWSGNNFFPQDAEAIETVVRDVCNLWPPNPSVHQISFDFDSQHDAAFLNLQSQHEILQEFVVAAFPNIEQVNFVPCINWRRWLPDGPWRAEVPKAGQEHVSFTWRCMHDKFVDLQWLPRGRT